MPLTLLGHGEAETALKVILPLAKRGILAGTVLSFARAMGEFGATLMRLSLPCELVLEAEHISGALG